MFFTPQEGLRPAWFAPFRSDWSHLAIAGFFCSGLLHTSREHAQGVQPDQLLDAFDLRRVQQQCFSYQGNIRLSPAQQLSHLLLH